MAKLNHPDASDGLTKRVLHSATGRGLIDIDKVTDPCISKAIEDARRLPIEEIRAYNKANGIDTTEILQSVKDSIKGQA